MKFDTDEVILHREGDRLIIVPKVKKIRALSKKWADWNWEARTEPEATNGVAREHLR